MSRIDALRSAFCCPKCRGRSATIDQARLRLVGWRLPSLKAGKYFVVTCTLCGYTEFYDRSLIEQARETVEEDAHAPAKPAAGNAPP